MNLEAISDITTEQTHFDVEQQSLNANSSDIFVEDLDTKDEKKILCLTYLQLQPK
jgi:hypothetical protein